MDETQHYDGILETYKKQETPLAEKREQFNKYLSDYQDEIKFVKNVSEIVQNKSIKRNQEKLKLLENMQEVLSVCQETDLTWKEGKQKQNKLCASKIKMISAAQNKNNKALEVSKDLRQLEIEHQLTNISTKMEVFQNKTRIVNEKVAEHSEDYQNLCLVKTSDYKISHEVEKQYKSKAFGKSLTKYNEEINQIKKSIDNIDAKAKELGEQL